MEKYREEAHAFVLMSMESNLLKLHRENETRNGRRAIEAVHICLLKVDGYLNDVDYDFDSFLTKENETFVNGLLMSFDPFTRDEIRDKLEKDYDLSSEKDLTAYFKEPVICLMRIERSVGLWTKERGANGYFNFLETQIGPQIKHDSEMNFTIEGGLGKSN